MATPSDLFDHWQFVDSLSAGAETMLSKSLSECEKGGPVPPDIQFEVARALRQKARECLRAAAAAYRERDGDNA